MHCFIDEKKKRQQTLLFSPGGEMGDTPDLGSGAERRVGSSPILGINLKKDTCGDSTGAKLFETTKSNKSNES